MVLLFVVGFWVKPVYYLALLCFVLIVLLTTRDAYLLFRKETNISIKRIVPKLLSLGDNNEILVQIENHTSRLLHCTIIDEIPIQFQKRNFSIEATLEPNLESVFTYHLRPVERGAYDFGKIHVFLQSQFGLIERRISAKVETTLPTFPSIMQMKELELRAFRRKAHQGGTKKMNRIGNSYEFEQIKNYVQGDDYRTINWKATSRMNKLMVNLFQDERSQQVYCIIDKSRVMNMPFEGLSLLDYSINSSLALSNIVLKKYDKIGLISFSDKLGTVLKAERTPAQLNKILHALYNEKEHGLEANYELFYYAIRRLVPMRSLLLLYTNFESINALNRVLPILRSLNRFHLLIVIFFENTEIKKIATQPANDLEEIYTQSIAQSFVTEKQQMVHKLQQYGISSILTRPQDLSITTINKYLELKARGLV